jgi:hypothetical protein
MTPFATKTNWSNAQIAKARATRDKVSVRGRIYGSVYQAFVKLGLPTTVHQAFRKTLKIRRKLVFVHDGRRYRFTIIRKDPKQRVLPSKTRQTRQSRMGHSFLELIATKLIDNLKHDPFEQEFRHSLNLNVQHSGGTSGYRVSLGKVGSGWAQLEVWYDRATGSKEPHLYVGIHSPSVKALARLLRRKQKDIQPLTLFPNGMDQSGSILVYPRHIPRNRLSQLFVEQHGKRMLAGKYFFDPISSATERAKVVRNAADFIRDILSIDDQDQVEDEREVAAVEAIKSNGKLTKTERRQLLSARIGQGQFRAALINEWRSCAVIGCSIGSLLRASHIKPWSTSSNKDRLNPANGLLLVATLDAAFDAGLISFSNRGAMLISRSFATSERKSLGLADGLRLRRPPSKAQQKFLKYHREHVFKG